ncbi:beta-galactosidase [Micromonospora arborensis]|uniref:beta-galactosidase n=1 Tax=Micromonospora arborensis TaxID=2116518 RepID=UPI003423FCCC
MSLPVTAKVPFGGDDNPERWPEDVYDFSSLDRIVERAGAEGRGICLATGTGDQAGGGASVRLPAYGVVVLRAAA